MTEVARTTKYDRYASDARHRGRPPDKPLEPLNDADQAAARYAADGDASAQLLALLLKHHPEHERAVKPTKQAMRQAAAMRRAMDLVEAAKPKETP